MWVSELISDSEGITQNQDVAEHEAEENIWTLDGGTKRRLD
jgi:hypothetical protein